MNDPYDYVIVGGGSAGYASARTAAAAGLKTAVVEGGEAIGGLCILRGCMPSKTLLESSNRYETILRAREFGLRANEHSVNGSEIVERKRRLVADFADYRRSQLESGQFDFIRGLARFLDPHTLEVTWPGEPTRLLQARAFLIATGSEIHDVEIPGLCEIGCRNSDSILEWEHIPESVIILGGGAIALEAAHYYVGLGRKVTVIQRSAQVLKEMDADVAESICHALEARGATVHTGTQLLRAEAGERGKRIVFRHGDEERMVEAEEIIFALGRQPCVKGLRLENAGVAMSGTRPKTDRRQQTSVPHIFAAGDVAGPFEIVHIAIEQGELAARNAVALLLGKPDKFEELDYRLKLFVVFTTPEVAAVGYTEKELTVMETDYAIACYPFDDHGKSMVIGETAGFVKLIADCRTREILGAAVVGPHASELIHEIAVAMHFRATAGDLAKVPHYHPTLSEIWTYPAEELAEV
jgi:pyruvate/2-oxoglutarate dehydrogenase complex dihydrolipoamide dehydrogenase (E3) component